MKKLKLLFAVTLVLATLFTVAFAANSDLVFDAKIEGEQIHVTLTAAKEISIYNNLNIKMDYNEDLVTIAGTPTTNTSTGTAAGGASSTTGDKYVEWQSTADATLAENGALIDVYFTLNDATTDATTVEFKITENLLFTPEFAQITIDKTSVKPTAAQSGPVVTPSGKGLTTVDADRVLVGETTTTRKYVAEQFTIKGGDAATKCFKTTFVPTYTASGEATDKAVIKYYTLASDEGITGGADYVFNVVLVDIPDTIASVAITTEPLTTVAP